MKKFLKKFFYNLFIGAIVLVGTCIWLDVPDLNNIGVVSRGLITFGMFCILLVMSIPIVNDNDEIAEQVKKSPITTTFVLLQNFNPEKNIKELRRLRKRVNQKISRSETNKLMIQATKEICGKNCKCQTTRKRGECEYCDMYDAYVNYLKEQQEVQK